jgi:hypothetical protein
MSAVYSVLSLACSVLYAYTVGAPWLLLVLAAELLVLAWQAH